MATNAADRYLLEGTPPTLRMNAVAEALPSAAPLTRVDLKTVVALLVPEPQRSAFEATGEVNLSYVPGKLGRFRLNCHRAMGAAGIVLRRVGEHPAKSGRAR